MHIQYVRSAFSAGSGRCPFIAACALDQGRGMMVGYAMFVVGCKVAASFVLLIYIASAAEGNLTVYDRCVK